jgi:hypothetical protein
MKQSLLSLQILILSSLSLTVWSDLCAQAEDYEIRLDFGHRWEAGFRGSRDQYRSQIDLGEGPKLFSGDLLLSLDSGWADRLELRMHSWGGEPYNTARLFMGKAGVYELRFDYFKAEYFSSIPSFANPFFQQGLPSQHRFDTFRRNLGVELKLIPGRNVSPFFTYRRASHGGGADTTFATDADEFQTGADLSQSSDDLGGGVDIQVSRMALRIEQGWTWFRDETSFRADGLQDGNLPGTFLGRQVFATGQEGANDFRGSSPYSRAFASFYARPDLDFRGAFTYRLGRFDNAFRESLSGNFFSRTQRAFFHSQQSQFASSAKSPSFSAEGQVSWRPFSFLEITEKLRTRRFHVAGELFAQETLIDVDPLLSPVLIPELTSQASDSTRFAYLQDLQELTATVRPNAWLRLRAGHRFDRRKLELDQLHSWNRNILILGGGVSFLNRHHFDADYELGRTDRAILRLDPVDFDRIRIKGRSRPLESLEIRGSVLLFDHENDVAGLDLTAENRDASIEVAWAPLHRLSLSAHYARQRWTNELIFIEPQTFLADRFAFREKTSAGGLHTSLLLVRGSRLHLGYNGFSVSGDFPLNYHQPSAMIEVPLTETLEFYGRWNHYGYNEKLNVFPQDFGTHLVVAGFRVLLSK